jgi:hypothetical protein
MGAPKSQLCKRRRRMRMPITLCRGFGNASACDKACHSLRPSLASWWGTTPPRTHAPLQTAPLLDHLVGASEEWVGTVRLDENFPRRTHQFVETSVSGILVPISR